MGEVCASRRCQREHSREGNAPATTERQQQAFPRAGHSCILQPSGMHVPVPDRPRAHGTSRAVTRAQPPPLLPSQKHACSLPHPAQTGRNTTATQQCSDCCTIYINTQIHIYVYIYVYIVFIHLCVYIHTHTHTERERERDILDIIV